MSDGKAREAVLSPPQAISVTLNQAALRVKATCVDVLLPGPQKLNIAQNGKAPCCFWTNGRRLFEFLDPYHGILTQEYGIFMKGNDVDIRVI